MTSITKSTPLKILSTLLAIISGLAVASGTSKLKIAAFWGQNSHFGRSVDSSTYEKPLKTFCDNYKYDIILIAYIDILFSRDQQDLPGLDLSTHCDKKLSPEFPRLLRCPAIEKDILECQKKGKKVFISIGGPTGDFTFPSPGKAREFAFNLWRIFLGDTSQESLRPFGKAILDGVNVQVEGGSTFQMNLIADFVQEMKRLGGQDTSKSYTIAVTVGCQYPDFYLGPDDKKLLKQAPTLIDVIFVMFYNNFCGSGKATATTLTKWLNYSKDTNGGRIFFGVPAGKGASSSDKDYKDAGEIGKIIQKFGSNPRFGGFMLWDASFDQNNVKDGKTYSARISALITAQSSSRRP